MPPQRSQRVASRPGLTGKPAKLARGQRGYRKHRTGFLNVKPIGSEIDVGLKNTRDSPLLRLPPEVRNRIWSFALGESPIKMKSTFLKSERNDSEYARWNLLRVCRQVYVETAMMAYTLATFHFAYIEDIRPYLRSKTLKHVQKIHLGTFSTDVVDVGNRVWARFFRSKNFPSLRKIKVTM